MPTAAAEPELATAPGDKLFDALSDRFDGIFKRLRGRGRLSDKDVDEVAREIRVALLEADVNVAVVKSFINRVKERARGAEVAKSLSPAQQVIKIVHEELVTTLGGETGKLAMSSKPPTVVMLAGLQGSGKTTAAGKLARLLVAEGRKPLLVAADLQRPAAVEQLRVLGQRIDVPVFSEPTDPVKVARGALKEADRTGRNVVILDTAGRLQIDDALMGELRRIRAKVEPHDTLLVVDAMTGQEAVNVAEAFDEVVGLDGVILTLIEKAEAAFDEEEAAKAEKKLRKGQFTLEDFLDQMQQVRKMGPLQNLVGMMPGLPKEARDAELDESQLGRIEAIIRSMTPEERRNPTVINGSRRLRIARGSGTSTQDVNGMLKQFKMVQQMMRSVAKGKMPRLPVP